MAREKLSSSQRKMKSIFIQHAARRVFTVGDCILALLLLVTSPFQVKFSGPYEVPKRLFELNYIISTPDYRKETQLCHVDLLKPYFHQVTSEPGVVEQSSMGGGHPVCSVGRVSTTPKVVAAEVEVGLPDLDPWILSDSDLIGSIQKSAGTVCGCRD